MRKLKHPSPLLKIPSDDRFALNDTVFDNTGFDSSPLISHESRLIEAGEDHSFEGQHLVSATVRVFL